MMVYATYVPWGTGIIKHIIGCVVLFICAVATGVIMGGIIGSLLQHRISYDTKSWKYMAVLLVYNLASPLIMYLMTKFAPYYD